MQEMNCLIVEDEPLAAQVIEDYIAQLPDLKLKGICSDVFRAAEKLRNEKIDVIFLDINLPKVNGLDFLRTINNKYNIIITTAYHQYALEGFNLNVTDYLLKPIEFARFLQAIHKIPDPLENRQFVKDEKEREYYFFIADKKRHKVFFDEIVYVESLKDYVKVHTADKTIVTKFQIGEVEQLLATHDFFRVHKSYLINMHFLSAFSAQEVELGKITLPLGRTYVELFRKKVEKA